MAYSINPNLVKARAIALRMHVIDGLSLSVTARKCGIHRTTLWRWLRKWRYLNRYCQLANDNRPSRKAGVSFRMAQVKWHVPTENSAPHTCPRAVAEDIVRIVLEARANLKRCAEIVWHHLTYKLGIRISLSSVKRIFRRHHIYDRVTKRRRSYHKSLPRPVVLKPGSLVQTDTIHLIDPYTMKRTYVYTVIDLYSRMAYAKVHGVIRPGLAVRTILEAQADFGFSFDMVQSDNGMEFSSYFEQSLRAKNIQTRHSRLHRPNDNAHIERFNRTIQEECTSRYCLKATSITKLQEKLNKYLDYYNHERIHLGIQLRTPSEMLQRY